MASLGSYSRLVALVNIGTQVFGLQILYSPWDHNVSNGRPEAKIFLENNSSFIYLFIPQFLI